MEFLWVVHKHRKFVSLFFLSIFGMLVAHSAFPHHHEEVHHHHSSDGVEHVHIVEHHHHSKSFEDLDFLTFLFGKHTFGTNWSKHIHDDTKELKNVDVKILARIAWSCQHEFSAPVVSAHAPPDIGQELIKSSDLHRGPPSKV